MTPSNEEVCFVIMPFKEELNPVLDAIREAVDRAGEGLQCIRLDDLRHAGRVTDDLTRVIESGKVGIADLSGMNPNVMWEIGFAMSREKPMILLAQATDNLPFDTKDFRVIRYDLITARKSLPSDIILALKETSKLYQWHAANSDDNARSAKSWLGARTLRISLSISLLALLAVCGFLWPTTLASASRHAREQLLAEVQRIVPETIVTYGEGISVASGVLASAEAQCPRSWIVKDGRIGPTPIYEPFNGWVGERTENGWKVTARNRAGPGRGEQLLLAQVTCQRPSFHVREP